MPSSHRPWSHVACPPHTARGHTSHALLTPCLPTAHTGALHRLPHLSLPLPRKSPTSQPVACVPHARRRGAGAPHPAEASQRLCARRGGSSVRPLTPYAQTPALRPLLPSLGHVPPCPPPPPDTCVLIDTFPPSRTRRTTTSASGLLRLPHRTSNTSEGASICSPPSAKGVTWAIPPSCGPCCRMSLL